MNYLGMDMTKRWEQKWEENWNQEQHSGNGKRRRWIRRVIVCVILLLFGILTIRRGVNFYLAKQAEGKLQTASSYKKIYQSFERVEMKQLQLRRKWENHRGIDLSLNLGGTNLSALMSSGGAAASVMGAITEVTGVGGYGIGQYHQYMMAASEQGDRDSQETSANEAENMEQAAMDAGMKPDQFIWQGEYIYAAGCLDESLESCLVIYHAAEGRMEQVNTLSIKDGWGTEIEMLISGHYLYLVTGDDDYGFLLYIYDITNPAKPQKKDVLKQSGDYERMQISGEYLYLLSKYQEFQAFDAEEIQDYIPFVGGKKNDKEIPAKDIYMQRDLYGTGYVVISAYRLSDDGKPELTDAKAVVGTGDCIQMNEDTIYICSQVVPKVTDHTDRTGITVLSYEDGKIHGEKHLIVPGSIDGVQRVSVNEACLSLPMQVNTYRNEFVEIEDWFLPGWEGVPMKIQMQMEAAKTRKQNIAIDGIGSKVHEVDIKSLEEQIRDLGFDGQLFEVDEKNYIGLGHTGEDKNVKLLWYTFTAQEEPELQASASIREYSSYAAMDSRRVYFNKDRSLIGFCATGSQGTVYYLYQYHKDMDTGEVELYELFQEDFGHKAAAFWIRGTMMNPWENVLYLVRNGSVRMEGLAKPIPFKIFA